MIGRFYAAPRECPVCGAPHAICTPPAYPAGVKPETGYPAHPETGRSGGVVIRQAAEAVVVPQFPNRDRGAAVAEQRNDPEVVEVTDAGAEPGSSTGRAEQATVREGPLTEVGDADPTASTGRAQPRSEPEVLGDPEAAVEAPASAKADAEEQQQAVADAKADDDAKAEQAPPADKSRRSGRSK